MKKTTLTSPLDAILKNVPGRTSCTTGCFHCVKCTLGSIFVATVATKISSGYTVATVATIAEEYVSIYRHHRRNTFFDDSGDSSDGSDYMETGLYATGRMKQDGDLRSRED